MTVGYAELSWRDRRGVGHVRSIRVTGPEDEQKILRQLKVLRRPAELWFGGVLVGGVEDLDETLAQVDDRRIRWNWWLSNKFSEQVTSCEKQTT